MTRDKIDLCECNTVKNPKKTNADFDAETKRKKVS
jgi:hypothetical protein